MPITVTARRKVIACRKFCLSRYQPSECLLKADRAGDLTFYRSAMPKTRRLIADLCSVPRYDPPRIEIRNPWKVEEGATRLILVLSRKLARVGATLAPNGLPGEPGKPFPRDDQPSRRTDGRRHLMKCRMRIAPSSPVALAPTYGPLAAAAWPPFEALAPAFGTKLRH